MRRSIFAGALFALTVGCSGPEPSSGALETAIVQDALEASLVSDEDTASVIVNLRPAAHGASFAERRSYHRRVQDRILAANGDDFTLSRRYEHVPALSGVVSRAALARLRTDPDVAYVQLDGTGSGALKEAVPAIGADKVHTMYGLTGRGVRVAILDTGVVTTHPDLKSSIVAQHCFTQYDCPPLHTTEGTSAEDDHGHGSNVAGIITSDGVVAPPGFAPGADIVAVKVDDANDAGRISDWVAGLDWVYDNLSMLDVRVINLSICSTELYTDAASCDLGEPALAAAVKNLVDAGVTIFSASGNQGSKSETSAPACNTGVIAVGATYDSNVGHQPPGSTTYAARWGSEFANCGDDTTAFDQITCFTNSNHRVDIVAPGAPMLSDSLNGLTETYWGTSQASPVGAGVAALMLECEPMLTPTAIKSAMTSTGVPRTDPKNGFMFPSLRALDAVQAVCFKGDAGVGGAGIGGAGIGGAPSAGAGGVPSSGGSANGGATSVAGAPGSAGLSASGGIPASGGVVGAGGASSIAGSPSQGGAVTSTGGSFTAGAGATLTASASASAGCNCAVPPGSRRSDSRSVIVALAGLAVVVGRTSPRFRRRRS
ncbi:MAG TPA: S8 family serine peptidase [Polyangiaceae bacterium]|jgi:subtilisin family serine protease|nr:S8 family serine peptidase [Polyangiaceae bacterium]